LLDRYLQNVRFFLPAKDQDDIVRELSENLISQIEDRESELGRSLDEAELVAILRQHGHPMVVAGRYRSHRHLIGPVFFPMYLYVLKVGLGVAALVTVVLASVGAAIHADPWRLREAIFAYPGRALMVFAWTTLGFALLDLMLAHVRVVGDWDPRRLPKVPAHEHQFSRPRKFCELAFAVLGVVWVLLLPGAPFLLVGPAATLVTYAPIWQVVYVPIALTALAIAALSLVNFVHPYWTKARSYSRLAIDAAWLLVLATLISSAELFVPLATFATSPEDVNVDKVVSIINGSFQIGFVLTGVMVVIEIPVVSRGSRPGSHTDAGGLRAHLALARRLASGAGLVHLAPLDVRRSHRRGLHARADMGRPAGPSRRAACPASITELPAADHRLGARLHSPRAYCRPS
jgi:hypothetical protein